VSQVVNPDAFVLFGLADPEAPPPLEMAEAVEGLTLEDTQTISLAQTAKIFPRLP
jgi:hypothetical protein